MGLRAQPVIRKTEDLSVSVIVSARNEAENIYSCLQSLSSLNYPENLLEIIIVNDRSEDETYEIIKKFIKTHATFKYLTIKEINPNLSGKANALSQAIQQSTGKVILVTDADCEVPGEWVRKVASYFTENVGMVAGFSLINNSKQLFSKLQLLDWAYLLTVAAGSFGLKIPLSCIGNNFAFRRSAYDEVGGYDGVGFSLTEDFALLRTFTDKTKWKLVFPLNADALVLSKPIFKLKNFFAQRKRWAIGGRSVHWFGKILIGTSVIFHFILLLSFFRGDAILISASLLAVIFCCDLFLLNITLAHFKKRKYLLFYPFYKLFFIFYALILTINLLFSQKIKWKGIEYSANNMIQKER